MIQACNPRSISLRFGLPRLGMAAAALFAPLAAWAQSVDPEPWQLNMGRGVTPSAHHAYDAHMFVLWVCVAIGILVFGAMAYAVFKFRKSKGAVAAQFSHNTTAEIVWTVVPVILLVVMAWPATAKLIAMYDTRDSAMTVKITGYQWLWQYEYLGEGVQITSRLDRDSERIRQSGEQPDLAANPHYLLDVDNPLVLPVDTKIRFVVTADDVIHAWWVPALGWKQDAIPGIINEAWAEILEPGVYRGQCAELCGKDHGFMPIVVRALPKAEYAAWLDARKAESLEPQEPSVISEVGEGIGPRQLDPDLVKDVSEGDEPTVPAALQPEDAEAPPETDPAPDAGAA